MKKILLSLYAILFLIISSPAQDYLITDSLKHNLELAKSPGNKILWLGELAGFYTNLNNELADHYGNQQLEIAETSRDRVLIFLAPISKFKL